MPTDASAVRPRIGSMSSLPNPTVAPTISAHELDLGHGDVDCLLAAVRKFVSSTAPRLYADFPQSATGHDTVG